MAPNVKPFFLEWGDLSGFPRLSGFGMPWSGLTGTNPRLTLPPLPAGFLQETMSAHKANLVRPPGKNNLVGLKGDFSFDEEWSPPERAGAESRHDRRQLEGVEEHPVRSGTVATMRSLEWHQSAIRPKGGGMKRSPETASGHREIESRGRVIARLSSAHRVSASRNPVAGPVTKGSGSRNRISGATTRLAASRNRVRHARNRPLPRPGECSRREKVADIEAIRSKREGLRLPRRTLGPVCRFVRPLREPAPPPFWLTNSSTRRANG